jgi:DNA-binding winged helix-turn-helix (wHTH) protein/tetratricopeptide (TPR) repeat protein
MGISFGEFDLDPRRYELRRNGRLVRVERRVFDLIHFLILNRDRVVSREEIFAELWTGRVVTTSSLNVAIAAARKSLCDTPRRQSIIKTVHGRGYRFVAPLRGQSTPNDPNGVGRPASAGCSFHPFVGRRGEFATLLASLDLATAGRAQCVLVGGEPGIGKTRLTEEFSQLAASRGAEVLTGCCSESEGAPALWPWIQITRGLVADRGHHAISSNAAAELAELLPELRGSSSAPRQISQDSGHARFRLFDAIAQVLERKARRTTLLIVVDDLHKSDLPSLELLHFILRGQRNARLLLLATYRENEIQRWPSRSQLLGLISRSGGAIALPLAGLTACEIQQFVEATTGQPTTKETVDILQDKTAGNPFFLSQLLPMLSRSPGILSDSLPLGIREAILRQLDGLPEATRSLLSFASVVGRDFTRLALELLVGRSDAEILDSLESALDAHLVTEISAGSHSGSYRFSHVLVRDALYGELPATERVRLHGLVGTALERIYCGEIEEHVAEIAHHFNSAAASYAERALEYAERAALAANRRFAYDESAKHYERCLAILEGSETSSDLKRCALLVALGAQQCRAGDRPAAKATFERAARLASAIGASELLAEAALGLAPGFLAVEGGVVDEFLIGLLDHALATLGDANDALRARLLARLAMALLWEGSAKRRARLVDEALQISQRISDPELSLYVMHARWLAQWDSCAFDRRYAESRELVSRAKMLRDREMVLVCLLFRLLTLLEMGEIKAFECESEAFGALAAELRQPQSIWYARLFKATRALLEGRFDDAERLAVEFSTLGFQINDANAFHSLMSHLLVLRWERGRLDEFLTLAEEGVRRFPEMVAWRAAFAWTLVQLGRLTDARIEFEFLASNGFASLQDRFDWPVAIALTTEVCCALGDRERAEMLYRLLLPGADRHLVIGLCVVSWGSASRQLGMLAATLQQWQQASMHFRNAISANERIGARPWLAHTMVDYAQMLFCCGEKEGRSEAHRLIGNALVIARELGMVNLVARAEKLAERASQ